MATVARGRVTSVAPIRRVVTGKNAEGKSTVIFDGPVPASFGGRAQTFWVTDSTPADNSGNRDATLGLTQWSPSLLFTWHFWVHEPGPPGVPATPPGVSGPPPSSSGSLFRVVDFPVGVGVEDGGEAWMHHTRAIDYLVILSGEIDLRMEDASEVHLKTGDVVVQRGVVHSWINRGMQPCRAAVIMIAAKE